MHYTSSCNNFLPKKSHSSTFPPKASYRRLQRQMQWRNVGCNYLLAVAVVGTVIFGGIWLLSYVVNLQTSVYLACLHLHIATSYSNFMYNNQLHRHLQCNSCYRYHLELPMNHWISRQTQCGYTTSMCILCSLASYNIPGHSLYRVYILEVKVI